MGGGRRFSYFASPDGAGGAAVGLVHALAVLFEVGDVRAAHAWAGLAHAQAAATGGTWEEWVGGWMRKERGERAGFVVEPFRT